MSDIAERVKKIVVEHLGVEADKVTDSANFIDDLGADSLDTVELVMAFEEEFNVEIPDDAAETIVRLNGEVRTRFATNHMLFGVAKFIATMTRNITLHPGDVIWMGTDGVSPDLKRLVKIEGASHSGAFRSGEQYETAVKTFMRDASRAYRPKAG